MSYYAILSLLSLLVLVSGDTLPLYKDASAPIPARVADLISRMTVDELQEQIIHKDSGLTLSELEAQFSSLGGVSAQAFFWTHAGGTASSTVAARNAAQAFFLNKSRLGIPLSVSQEGLHSSLFGTIFPEPLLTACSWNDTLVGMIGGALAAEARAIGVDNDWSPVVNMFSDDRFGRYQEGFCPDPTITSHMGRALVVGMQGGEGDQSDYLPSYNTSCWSSAKHFAGYGSAAGGLNGAPFVLNNRTLFEWYLRPWRAMVASGLRGVMPSHNTVLDVPMHANRWLVNDILRGEFGFGEGVAVSDCNDVSVLVAFGIATNLSQAAGFGAKASVDLDLQCGSLPSMWAYSNASIQEALAAGILQVSDLAALVSHVLTQKFAAGLFDFPFTPENLINQLDSPMHRQLAYETAAQSIVLLQNINGTLPLNLTAAAAAPLPSIALIGPNINNRDSIIGSYVMDTNTTHVVLFPEAFQRTFLGLTVTQSAGCNIDGDPGLELIPAAVAAAAAADYAVLVLGDSINSCGEWLDRDSLDLPGGQLQLLEALVNQTTTPLILVLVNGRAATFGIANALLPRMAAVIEAWRPGEEGAQAVVDIISGAVNPSGKLANQWSQNVGQMASGSQPWLARRVGKWVANARGTPDPTDGRVFDPYISTQYVSTPLFRFGHGLSYTTYEYVSLALAVPPPAAASRLSGATFSGRGKAGYQEALATIVFNATIHICNSGGRDGTEIVQVYAQSPKGASALGIVPFWKRLIGYGRIFLAAGACDDLTVPIIADDFAQYDDAMVLTILPGTYTITAGGRSDRDFLNQTITF